MRRQLTRGLATRLSWTPKWTKLDSALAKRTSTALAPPPEEFASSPTRIAHAAVLPNAVELTWEDETTSTFHHCWLRDHCRQSVHPVSHQREVPLSAIRRDAAPSRVTIEERPHGQAVSLHWPASVDPSGAASRDYAGRR